MIGKWHLGSDPTGFDRWIVLPGYRQTIARDLNKNDLKQAPPKGLEGKDLVKRKYQRYMQDYLACVQGVDDSVGRMLDYLDESGLAKNTIVFYSADNGWNLGDLGFMTNASCMSPA